MRKARAKANAGRPRDAIREARFRVRSRWGVNIIGTAEHETVRSWREVKQVVVVESA